jgi:5'-nucleotidase
VNVPNIPRSKVKGYRVTFQGKKHYADITREDLDPRGRKYYWICGEESGFDDIPGSDCNAVADGFISVLPLKINPTDFAFLRQLKTWRI